MQDFHSFLPFEQRKAKKVVHFFNTVKAGFSFREYSVILDRAECLHVVHESEHLSYIIIFSANVTCLIFLHSS